MLTFRKIQCVIGVSRTVSLSLLPKVARGQPFVRAFSSSQPPIPDIDQATAEKLERLEKIKPSFDQLIQFDPDFMARLPIWLDFLDPVVEKTKDIVMQIHDVTGLPWVGVIFATCFLVRSTLLPLIYVQMKRAGKLASVFPVITQAKRLMDQSKLPKVKKWSLFGRVVYRIIRKQKLKSLRLVLFNVIHIPLLVNLVWSMRRLLTEKSFAETSFLWIPSLSAIDPYYIIPALTAIGYYYNIGRFITKENKHTLISRLKGYLQMAVILWFPILCNWPSAITLYMFANAVFSIVQTSVLASPTFYKMVNPKMIVYQSIIRLGQYDKAQSQSLIESIKTGEESFSHKAIREEALLEQTEEVVRKLKLQKTKRLQEMNKEGHSI